VLLGRDRLGMRYSSLPDSASLGTDIYRLLMAAVVFQSLMLIAGAAWAQNAWQRYWAWDQLESWAFVNWTVTLLFLHLYPRSTARAKLGAIFSLLIFGVAFYTFFGVPFISTSPHKGAV
jgi:ABC-type transport system involved in cytochrome c biogenesis permease subunit